jgi:hypothetical protein
MGLIQETYIIFTHSYIKERKGEYLKVKNFRAGRILKNQKLHRDLVFWGYSQPTVNYIHLLS